MKEIRFDDQVAIVTGANSEIGIGYHYAKLLAERGAKVMIHGRREEKVKETAKKLSEQGHEVEYGVFDVCDESAIKKLVNDTIKKWGRIDILINNAGGSDSENWPNFTMEETERLFRINVSSSMCFMREVWPYMQKQKHGRIINTSSDSTFGGYSVTSYPITKSAIFGLVKSTALLGRVDNIFINGIYPMAFTQLTSQLPKGEFYDKLKDYRSELLAPVIAYLCSRDNDKYTGEMFSVGGGGFTHVRLMATNPEKVETLEDVPAAMERAHRADAACLPINNAFDDMMILGMPGEAIQSLMGNSNMEG